MNDNPSTIDSAQMAGKVTALKEYLDNQHPIFGHLHPVEPPAFEDNFIDPIDDDDDDEDEVDNDNLNVVIKDTEKGWI